MIIYLPTHWACSYNRSFCLNDFLPSFWIWRFIFDHNHIIMCLTSEIRIVKFSIGKSNIRLVIHLRITYWRTPPITSPSGNIPGRSLRLWTTMSTRPSSKASSNAYEREVEIFNVHMWIKYRLSVRFSWSYRYENLKSLTFTTYRSPYVDYR